MNPRWFISSTVRHATTMRKHVQNILNAQRDILTPPAIENVTGALTEFNQAIHTKLTKEELHKQMEKLEGVANKWLKPYPNANYRENIEVFLVALAVAMGIRTFFVQPFKIPTNSMWPSYYGMTAETFVDGHEPGLVAKAARLVTLGAMNYSVEGAGPVGRVLRRVRRRFHAR